MGEGEEEGEEVGERRRWKKRGEWGEGGRRGGEEIFFFQAEDDIRGLVRSRGLGGVYMRKG